jgi:hypothetical protein
MPSRIKWSRSHRLQDTSAVRMVTETAKDSYHPVGMMGEVRKAGGHRVPVTLQESTDGLERR